MRRITKIGSIVAGVGAGAVAIAWLIKDRLLGPEASPVDASRAPAFRVAPADAPVAPATGSDDLSAVKGIGPVYRARLEKAGISSFAALAAAKSALVAQAAEVTEERATDWITQAATFTG